VLLVGQDFVLLQRCREPFLHGDNYEIETLAYCDDALRALRQESFDLVLVLSVNAPWRAWPSLSEPTPFIGLRSAIIFLDQLRALQIRVPVLIVSQWPYAKEQALANGAFAFVDPFEGQELDRLVSLALSADRPTRGSDSVP
jgi:DNA-binding NarL/FixJ family response regulator